MVKVKDSERERRTKKELKMREREKKRNLQMDETIRFDVCKKKPAEGSRLHFAFDI